MSYREVSGKKQAAYAGHTLLFGWIPATFPYSCNRGTAVHHLFNAKEAIDSCYHSGINIQITLKFSPWMELFRSKMVH